MLRRGVGGGPGYVSGNHWLWETYTENVIIVKALRKKCPNTEFFLFRFSHIWTESGDLQNLHIQFSDGKIWAKINSTFGHFSHSENSKQLEKS